MIVATFLLLSLRSMVVGTDVVNYYIKYHSIYENSFISGFSVGISEPFFFFLNKICGVLSNGNFQFFIIICSASFALLYSEAVFLLSNNQWLSWYLTVSFSVLVFPLSGIRSSFGLIYGLLSVYFICRQIDSPEKKNLLLSILFSVIALLHHYTAIIYLVFIPMQKLKSLNRKLYYSLLGTLIIIFYLFGGRITSIMQSVFFATKEYSESTGRGYAMLAIIFLMILSLQLLVKEKNKDQRFSLLMCLLEVSFVIQILALSFSLWVRVAQFTFIVALIMIPDYIYKTYLSSKSRAITIVVLCLFFFYWYTQSLLSNTSAIVPYTFFWENSFLLK